MNPRTSPRRPPTCSALIMLQPHPSSTPRFYGAAANRGYSPLRSNEGIHEGMSNLVQALQEQVARLHAQLEEAREQIRQLRETLRPSNVTRYPELYLTESEEALLQIIVTVEGVSSRERLFQGLY